MVARFESGGFAVVRLRTRFIDPHHLPVDRAAIQGGDGCLPIRITAHLDECKTRGYSGVPVVDNLYGQYFPECPSNAILKVCSDVVTARLSTKMFRTISPDEIATCCERNITIQQTVTELHRRACFEPQQSAERSR